jgi:hypothetical protein
METTLLYELIGYLASFLVAISLMMSQIIRLRIVNLLGALTFSAYGFLIGSLPVALMNAFIVGINIYYLAGMLKMKSFFKILKVDARDEYLRYFLDFYIDDIRNFQPDAPAQPTSGSFNMFVLRDMIPAGLLSGRITAPGVLTVDIDYVISKFRDFKIAKFMYIDQKERFKAEGIREIYTFAFVPTHVQYLKKIGFVETSETGRFKMVIG